MYEQTRKINKTRREYPVFEHIRAREQQFRRENEREYIFVNFEKLISKEYLECEIICMALAKNMQDYYYIYETRDFAEVYKLYALDLAINTEKVIRK